MLGRLTIVLMLGGCAQVIGIRELGVEPPPPSTEAPALEGGTSSPVSDGEAPLPEDGGCTVPDVAGRWNGSFTPMLGGTPSPFVSGTGSAAGELTQNCDVVTGSLSIDGCLTNGEVLGSIEDGVFVATVTASEAILRLEATIASPNQLSGTFTIERNLTGCYAAAGAFKILRP